MNRLMHQEIYEEVLSLLLAYEEKGVKITKAGIPSSPRDIAFACAMRKNYEYMLDYIPDDSGRIEEIRFEDFPPMKSNRSFQSKYYKTI